MKIALVAQHSTPVPDAADTPPPPQATTPGWSR